MTREEIIDYIRQFIAQDAPDLMENIEPDSDLFEAKAMDSFHILTLVLHLEEKLEMTLNQEDMTEANFRTLDAVAALVLRYAKVST